jgi:hypothetical protein
MRKNIGRQEGATLLIVMIILIMLTLFAVSAMNTGNINLKVVGNMQTRAEAADISQSVIDQTISSTQFIDSPANALPSPCGAPNTACTDINQDGNPDYTTTLTPQPSCVQARVIKLSELNISLGSNDLPCVAAQQQGTFGIQGATGSGDSLCGQSVWEVSAQTLMSGATVANSPVNVTTVQGVAVRIKATDIATSCS